MKCQLLDAKRYTKADFKVYLKPAEVIKFVLRNKKICEWMKGDAKAAA